MFGIAAKQKPNFHSWKPKKRLSILLNYDCTNSELIQGVIQEVRGPKFDHLPLYSLFTWPSVDFLLTIYLPRDGKRSPTSSYPRSYWMPPNLIFFPIWNIKYQGVNWGSIDSFYFKFSRTCTHQIYFNLNHLNLQYIKSGNYSLLFVYFKRLIFVIAWLAASLNNSSISAIFLQKCKVRHLALKICNWRLQIFFFKSVNNWIKYTFTKGVMFWFKPDLYN